MRDIEVITGKKPGKTVAVFGGVHGNETVGVDVVRKMMETLTVDAGTVYLVIANTEAVKRGERFCEKNLNRCFIKGNEEDTYEDHRARALMKILDGCDALLDIHSFTNPTGVSFAICEEAAFCVAEKFNVPIISSGWTDVEPGGTDDYMHQKGKIGICLESGPFVKYEESYAIADHALTVFLKHFNIIEDAKTLMDMSTKRYVHAHTAVFRKTEEFSFSKDYSNFDLLKEGFCYAKDGDEEYIAEKGDCIILPTPNEPIGGEIFILGKEVTPKN